MSVDGPRAPRPDERDGLIANANLVKREELGHRPTMELDWGHIFTPENLENNRVIAVDGRIVCSVGIWCHDSVIGTHRIHVGGICAMATDPAHRRRGYGARVLRACVERMVELGCHISMLGTGVPGWYRKLGWEHAGLSRCYRINPGNKNLLPRDAELVVREAAEDDFAAMAEIHNARRLGAVRSPEYMWAVMNRSWATAWVGVRAGVIQGYLWGSLHDVREYGGPPEVVLAMVRELHDLGEDASAPTSTQSLQDRKASRVLERAVRLDAPELPDPVTGALDRLGLPYSRDYLYMVRLEDVRGLLAAYGRSDIQVAEHKDAIEFAAGSARLRLSRTEAVKLLFGPERPAGFESDRLPLPFHQWTADKV